MSVINLLHNPLILHRIAGRLLAGGVGGTIVTATCLLVGFDCLRPDLVSPDLGFQPCDRRSGCGLNGALHAKELRSVGITAGSAFKKDAVSNVPSGVPDIAPTMLHLLGMPRPSSMTGRVLREALVAEGDQREAIDAPLAETFDNGNGAFEQQLRRIRYAGVTYQDGGWRITPSATVPSEKATTHA